MSSRNKRQTIKASDNPTFNKELPKLLDGQSAQADGDMYTTNALNPRLQMLMDNFNYLNETTQEACKMAEDMTLLTLANQTMKHVLNTNNPHQTNKNHVGLGNVDNTSDIDKPISLAVTEVLKSKQSLQPDLVLAHAGLDFNTLTTPGFYEFFPVPPAVMPGGFPNAPVIGQNYQSLVLHVFKGINTNVEQTPVIYQVGYAIATAGGGVVVRASRDNGVSWTPWGSVHVINSLSNTSTTAALSAEMGRQLRVSNREGAWTPTWAGTAGRFTLANHGSQWSKAGNVISIAFDITLTRAATGTTNLIFGGLPFAENRLNSVPAGNVTIATQAATAQAFININSNQITLVNQTHGNFTAADAGIGNNVGNTARIRGGFVYRVPWA
ncbi:MAG: pyocin knob domain-containing protein [Defluviitaleaceae bacterium]|nr:pyocin knob domain-containing protein [Defluviitaleaceae bacterium]